MSCACEPHGARMLMGSQGSISPDRNFWSRQNSCKKEGFRPNNLTSFVSVGTHFALQSIPGAGTVRYAMVGGGHARVAGLGSSRSDRGDSTNRCRCPPSSCCKTILNSVPGYTTRIIVQMFNIAWTFRCFRAFTRAETRLLIPVPRTCQ